MVRAVKFELVVCEGASGFPRCVKSESGCVCFREGHDRHALMRAADQVCDTLQGHALCCPSGSEGC